MPSDTLNDVPRTLAQATDPAWLGVALRDVTRGAPITRIEVVEIIRTMATKVRFTAAFEGARGGTEAFCLKAFLDVDADVARGGAVTIKEGDFYTEIAPRLPIRLAACVASIADRQARQGVIIMRDLIDAGARMCTALDAFTADETARSLDQIAQLHAHRALLDGAPWIDNRLAGLARAQHVSQAALQDLLDGPRGEGLPARTRDAGLLIAALKALAAADDSVPHTLVHGDCHAGNVFQTTSGPGFIDWQLVQRGSWALDVAYHVAAVLPVDVAAREERALLVHYLDAARRYGAVVPDVEPAWAQYRTAVVYGYYLWAITRRVEPAITNTFVQRLGAAVTRHDSHRLLGVA